ncbi:PRP38-domain-containing protein [Xylaria sp. FL0064]|nr:PRP38-domain-containing protein [Xylaria sp. FL0064]
MPSDTHRADERRFLDERGSNAALAPNGLNPATIMEKAVRERIVDSYFWKEQCFGVNEADIVDRVVDHVSFIGGTYGDTQKPSPFLCLAFKLLQLAPGDDVLDVYLGYGGDKFKYLRALACFYVRLTRKAESVFMTLEPFLEDRRKLRRRGRVGARITYVDEFVDELLTKERVCATSLWQMPKREILEDLEVLEPRISPLGDIEDLLDEDEEEGDADDARHSGESGDGDRSDDDDERRNRDGDRDDGDRDGDREEGEEGEIRGDRRRRSPSSAGYDSERDRRRSSTGQSSDGDRMDVDRERRDDDKSESGSRRRGSRNSNRSRSDSR